MLYKVSRAKLILQWEGSWTNSLLSCLQRHGRAKPEAGNSSCSGSRTPCGSKAKQKSRGKNHPNVYFEKLTRNKVANIQEEALQI